ncbi:hypothetical protein ACWDE9_28000, partial [Streptomyces olivaceoviridis]
MSRPPGSAWRRRTGLASLATACLVAVAPAVTPAAAAQPSRAAPRACGPTTPPGRRRGGTERWSRAGRRSLAVPSST